MKTFILFGKQLFRDGQLDWIAQSRCDLAIELINKTSNGTLIITGGKTTQLESEASVMKKYISNKLKVNCDIILEESGLSTIHQLVVLKNDYLLPKRQFEIGLISDEIHMPRIELTARHLLGDDFIITTYKSEVRISGRYRQSIENFERDLFDLTAKNPVLVNYPKGDDKMWKLYDEFYRNKKKELNSIKVDVNEEFLKYVKSREE